MPTNIDGLQHPKHISRLRQAVSQTKNEAPFGIYETGDQNRILDDGIYTYEYDNEGNRTRRVDKATGEVTEYTWDHRNRLTAVVTLDSDGTVIKEAMMRMTDALPK